MDLVTGKNMLLQSKQGTTTVRFTVSYFQTNNTLMQTKKSQLYKKFIWPILLYGSALGTYEARSKMKCKSSEIRWQEPLAVLGGT
jgi:hypothetical protein